MWFEMKILFFVLLKFAFIGAKCFDTNKRQLFIIEIKHHSSHLFIKMYINSTYLLYFMIISIKNIVRSLCKVYNGRKTDQIISVHVT